MKIDTGNFGQATVQLNPINTQRGGGALAIAQATAGAAQQQQQVGQQISRLGEEVYQRSAAVAAAKAQEVLSARQTYAEQVKQTIAAGVQDRTLSSTDIDKAYQDGMAGAPDNTDIPGLDATAAIGYRKGIQRLDASGQMALTALKGKAQQYDARDSIYATQQNMQQIAANPMLTNGEIEMLRQQQQELYFDKNGNPTATASVAFGRNALQESTKGVQGFNRSILNGQIERFRNDPAGLDEVRNLANTWAQQGTLDIDAQNSVRNAIDGRQNTLATKAAAAQNHADSVATRREVAATHADSQMQVRIAKGEIPTDADWDKYEAVTNGTTVAGNTPVLRQSQTITQQLLTLPPAQAQMQIDATKLQLQQNGGSATQYAVLDAVQRSIDQRSADLKANPQSVGAQDAGTVLTPLPFAAVNEAPGDYGAGLQTRLINSQAVQVKYGPMAGKDLLTPDERADFQQGYGKLTPDEKIQTWRNITASSSPEIAARLSREIGGDSLTVATVAAHANTPEGYATAVAVEKGTMILNPKDGGAKVKTPPMDDVMQAIGRQYPQLSVDQVQRMAPVVLAHAFGTGATADNIGGKITDSAQAVIGQQVKIGSARLIVPASIKPEVFSDTINKSIDRLGDTGQNIRNNLDNGTYTFFSDASDNQVLINVATNRRVKVNGAPLVIEVNK